MSRRAIVAGSAARRPTGWRLVHKLLFTAHWIGGITAGVVLAIMGATGAVLSFEAEILRYLNPGVLTVSPQARPVLAPAQLYGRMLDAHPERRIRALSLWSHRDRAARVGLEPEARPAATTAPSAGTPGAAARPPARVRFELQLVDPYSGALLGHDETLRGHAVLHFIEDLHRKLALGDFGKAITGICAFALLALGCSGLYLRWPRHPLRLRSWLRIEWRLHGRGFLWSLHSTVGTWLVPLYIVSALTGLWWSYDWYRDGVTALAGVERPARSPMRETADGEPLPAADLERTWQVFVAQAPAGWQSVNLTLPAAPGEPVQISYLDAEPAHERASNRIVIDPATGAVQVHERYADKTGGGKLVASMFVLHKGSYFGLTGTLVMMVVALGLPVFALTGWLMYLSRRNQARKRDRALSSLATVAAGRLTMRRPKGFKPQDRGNMGPFGPQ